MACLMDNAWYTPRKPDGLEMYMVPDGVILKWNRLHGNGIYAILDYNIQILKTTDVLWSESVPYCTKQNFLKINLAYGKYRIRVRGRSRLGIGHPSDTLVVTINNSPATKCCHCKKNVKADSLSSHQKKCMDRDIQCPDCFDIVKLKLFDEHECQQERPEENFPWSKFKKWFLQRQREEEEKPSHSEPRQNIKQASANSYDVNYGKANICQYKDVIPRTHHNASACHAGGIGAMRNSPKNETMEGKANICQYKDVIPRTHHNASACHAGGIGAMRNSPKNETMEGYQSRIESVTAKSRNAIEMLKLEINSKTEMNGYFKEAIIKLKEKQRRLINNEDDINKAISIVNDIKKMIYNLKEKLKDVTDENANLRAEIEDMVNDVQKRLDDHELKIERFINGPVTDLENLLQELDF